MRSLRRIDIFPKFDSRFEADARDKTVFGAILSVTALIVVALLFVSELKYYYSIEDRHELFVDTADATGEINIFINITFHRVPCDLMTLDCIDAFGENMENLDKTTVKRRLDREGNFIDHAEDLVNTMNATTAAPLAVANPSCGSCYGAEDHPGQCCNTCEEVQAAYGRRGWSFHLNDVGIVQCAKERLDRAKHAAAKEGCNIATTVRVKRVQGNLHFVPGRAFMHLGHHMHDVGGDEIASLNLSHTIHHLGFGVDLPGLANPLDGRVQVVTEPTTSLGKYQYFVKVVPTRYEKLSGVYVETNQYSVTEHYSNRKDESFLPGLFFLYDLSPIKVHIYEARPYASLAHFVLQLCAIGGGVFTVMGLVDALLYHGIATVKKKISIGKLS